MPASACASVLGLCFHIALLLAASAHAQVTASQLAALRRRQHTTHASSSSPSASSGGAARARYPVSAPPGIPAAVLRQTVDGDGYGGDGYTVRPLLRNEEPATAILLHGLGGSGEEWGFVSLAFSFFSLNYVKFIIPSAPARQVTYLNETLPSWFDITRLDDFSSDVNRAELLASVARVAGLVRGEVAAGVRPDRVFLIGFSQGGAVALTAFLRAQFPVAGCIGVATWLPLVEEYPAELAADALQSRSLLMIHGTEDDAVSISQAVDAVNAVNRFGRNINLTADINRLEGQGHILVTTKVMNQMEQYIAERANGTQRFLVKIVADLTASFDGLNNQLSNTPLLSLF